MKILGNESVATLMTTEIISVSPEDTLKKVKNLLMMHNIRHLVVLKDNNLEGILSHSDIDKFFYKSNSAYNEMQIKLMESVTAKQLMTKSVHTLQHDDSIKEAAEILALCSYHALPVMMDEKLIGIVTTTDLLQYLLRHCQCE